MDGVRIKAGEKFSLVSRDGTKVYKINGPHDPTLPPDEDINCRCIKIPVLARFAKTNLTEKESVAVKGPVKADDDRTYQDFLESLPEADRQEILELRAANKAGTITREIYSDGLGNYTPERKAEHDQIVRQWFRGKDPAPKGRAPRLLLTGGLPGSGKSNAKNARADIDQYLDIDSDAIKAKLPGYNGKNAALYQDEVDDVIEKIMEKAGRERYDILFDGTMKSARKYRTLVPRYKALGYKVSGLFVDSDLDASMASAWKRYKRSGRFVDPQYIATHDKLNIKTFDELKEMMEDWELWRREAGEAPKMIGRSE
jgi:predicted ABC-type ATPase